ncbi:MAG: hypothetical protein GF355_15565, partial [Candidatus Eisenbacteria bacterium]|nr:hypothetical protein [Candidatus Latescibacterota bacterium]MBD3336930.1 hypothetical protein [Candidatus Eisenbacteria bacterium]
MTGSFLSTVRGRRWAAPALFMALVVLAATVPAALAQFPGWDPGRPDKEEPAEEDTTRVPEREPEPAAEPPPREAIEGPPAPPPEEIHGPPAPPPPIHGPPVPEQAGPPVPTEEERRAAAPRRELPPVTGERPDSVIVTRLWDFSPAWHPAQDILLWNLHRRRESRSYVRDTLGLFQQQLFGADTVAARLFLPAHMDLTGRDQATLQQTPDLEQRTLQRYRVFGDVVLGVPVDETYEQYLQRISRRGARELWKAEIDRSLEGTDVPSQAGLVRLDLPVELPSQLSPIFGKGKPNLSVRGSERITLAGTSTWHPNRPRSEFQTNESKFPQLDMKQELNLRLAGNIGDKVTVEIDQSSQAVTPLENRVKIHYTGYEDEVVQRVDLGNTSLNLPNTRYVSSGGTHKGLFGINARGRLADVELNMILSKQEGETSSKSTTRSSETQTTQINDLNYVANQYFFLSDPEGPPLELDTSTLLVFLDDWDGTNNQESLHGLITLNGGADTTGGRPSYQGFFDELWLQDDYIIQTDMYYDHPVLILNRPLLDEQVLAVVYETESGQRVGNVAGDSLVAKMIKPSFSDPLYDPQNLETNPWADTADLEMKNIYWLGARGIIEESLEIKIRRRGTTGDVYQFGDFTYLQILGLDLLERSGETGLEPSLSGDDIVDPQWVDPESGHIIFPTLRPFDPSPADSVRLDEIIRTQGLDPDSLPNLPAGDRNPQIYDRKDWDPNPLEFSKFYFDVSYRSPITTLRIDDFNIIEGSEVISAGGRTLARDRDYRIDYATGEIEILPAANLTEDDEIKVTYSTIPLVGDANRSLFGIAAGYHPEGSPLALSTAWMFESQGSQDRRPRFGQEPRRTAVGEVVLSYKSEPWLITSLVDKLPGVDARARSTLNIDTGLGISMPNPNTRGLLYLDDFDGAHEVQEITLNRQSWMPSSIPANAPGADEEERAARRAESWFYTPRNVVQAGDLQPSLEETEADDNRTVLELSVFPFGTDSTMRRGSWTGITNAIARRDV